MSIVVKCRCKRRILFPDSAAGLEGECPRCSSTFVIRRPLPWRWIACGLLVLPLSCAMALPRLFRTEASERPDSAPVADDFANDFETALPVALTLDAKAVSMPAILDAADDVDVFKVPCEGATSLTLTVRRPRSSKVSIDVSVYDADQKPLQSTEINEDSARSEVIVPLTDAAACYVKVTSADESTGKYELLLAASSDIGDTTESAHPLEVPRDGTATIDSEINVGGDHDLFRVVAPMTGTITVWQRATETDPNATRLDSYLMIYDADMLLITSDDSSGLNEDAQASFAVTEGVTYYIQAGGYESSYSGTKSTGGYTLTVSSLPYTSMDSVGGTTDTAQSLDFYSNVATYDSAIDEVGDRDLYRVDITETMMLRVEVLMSGASTLEAQVVLYDDALTPLASSEISMYYVIAQANVEAGKTYYIGVAHAPSDYAFGTETGNYSLTATLDKSMADDIPATFDGARLLTLDSDGWTYVEERIGLSQDEDMFELIAPFDGEIEIEVRKILGSTLDSVIVAYDSASNEIGRDDDGGDIDGDARLLLNLTAGAVYYFRVSGYVTTDGIGSTGDYSLSTYRGLGTSTPTPAGDDFSGERGHAHEIVIQPDTAFTISGMTEYSYDMDFFELVSPATGKMTITLEASGESRLDTELLVQNSAGDSLGTNDNISPEDVSSQLVLDVVEGQTYYLAAAASLLAAPDRTSGAYRLTVLPPGVSPPADAAPDDDQTAPDAPTP